MTKNTRTVDNFDIITIYEDNCQYGGTIYGACK